MRHYEPYPPKTMKPETPDKHAPLPCPCCGREASAFDVKHESKLRYQCPDEDCVGGWDAWPILQWNSFPRPSRPAEGVLRRLVKAWNSPTCPHEVMVELILEAESILANEPPVEVVEWRQGEPPRDGEPYLVNLKAGTDKVYWDHHKGKLVFGGGCPCNFPFTHFAPMPKGPGGGR